MLFSVGFAVVVGLRGAISKEVAACRSEVAGKMWLEEGFQKGQGGAQKPPRTIVRCGEVKVK